MSAKHTPGEWGVEGAVTYASGTVAGHHIAMVDKSQPDGFNGRIAEAFSNCLVKTQEESLANAHLIAAAPDLLASLMELAPLAERLVMDGDISINMGRRISAAIAKATGEPA